MTAEGALADPAVFVRGDDDPQRAAVVRRGERVGRGRRAGDRLAGGARGRAALPGVGRVAGEPDQVPGVGGQRRADRRRARDRGRARAGRGDDDRRRAAAGRRAGAAEASASCPAPRARALTVIGADQAEPATGQGERARPGAEDGREDEGGREGPGAARPDAQRATEAGEPQRAAVGEARALDAEGAARVQGRRREAQALAADAGELGDLRGAAARRDVEAARDPAAAAPRGDRHPARAPGHRQAQREAAGPRRLDRPRPQPGGADLDALGRGEAGRAQHGGGAGRPGGGAQADLSRGQARGGRQEEDGDAGHEAGSDCRHDTDMPQVRTSPPSPCGVPRYGFRLQGVARRR